MPKGDVKVLARNGDTLVQLTAEHGSATQVVEKLTKLLIKEMDAHPRSDQWHQMVYTIDKES